MLVSLLVPTYNSSQTLEALMLSLLQQTYQPIEIVLVDNGSTDGTLDIARKYTDKIYTQGPERSAQRNFAASMASGQIYIVIDSDMVLSPRVVEDVVNQFLSNPARLALVIPEESFGTGYWAKCKMLERSFYVGVHWMEAARAFRKCTFDALGGYDESNTGTEDYDLPHRIEWQFGHDAIGRINSVIFHDEGEFNLIRSCMKKYYYAQQLGGYIGGVQNKNYFSRQANPLARFSLYLNSPKKLFINPGIGIGLLVMKSMEMVFGALGYLTKGSANKFKNRIYK